MTRARAELVRESALAGVARTLDLGARLVLGPGEMKTGGHRRDSILADALEAVIAAIYLDGGFDACAQRVLPWFEPLLAALPPLHQVGKDAKTRLQEWLQARQRPLPAYALVEESGDDHDKRFRVGLHARRSAAGQRRQRHLAPRRRTGRRRGDARAAAIGIAWHGIPAGLPRPRATPTMAR